jgi:hypothetical protein
MAETPEIPEAKDPFDKRVAISIAILAMLLSFITNHGDNARNESLRLTTEKADQWSYYQAQSLKEHGCDEQIAILEALAPGAVDAAKREAAVAAAKADQAGYHAKKVEAKAKADRLEGEVRHQLAVNERCDLAQLILQVGVIICSLGILSKSRWFWFKGLLLGLVGLLIGGSAWLVAEEKAEAAAEASAPATAPTPAEHPGTAAP